MASTRIFTDDTAQAILARLTSMESSLAPDVIKAMQQGSGAGLHNSIFRGKSLGSSVTTAQYDAIGAGTFDDLWIGDYWTIGGINYRIADFDYWLHCGDTETTAHHVVIVPDECLYKAQMKNTESGQYVSGDAANSTAGAYIGSDMYTTNLETAKTTINTAFGSSHILSHKTYLQNATTDGHSSGGAWYASTVDLMNENMVYGCPIISQRNSGGAVYNLYTIDKSQLNLFRLRPDLIISWYSGSRQWYWLRDVVSAINFAVVTHHGYADHYASSHPGGVRPAFAIRKAA